MKKPLRGFYQILFFFFVYNTYGITYYTNGTGQTIWLTNYYAIPSLTILSTSYIKESYLPEDAIAKIIFKFKSCEDEQYTLECSLDMINWDIVNVLDKTVLWIQGVEDSVSEIYDYIRPYDIKVKFYRIRKL